MKLKAFWLAAGLALFVTPSYAQDISGDWQGTLRMTATEKRQPGTQVKAFEQGLPSARVVRLPGAEHYVFRSNEADVLREMNSFLAARR